MADLRSKFIEDYAGGLLNVSRQELSSTGEVLSQDGFLSDATLFVEDGSGSKSGLKLGNSLCEVVDPTTPQGAMNVRYADRTYASTRDLKIFSTAIASAQAALSDAAATSITNLENAFQLLETSQDTLQSRFDANVDSVNGRLADLEDQINLTDTVRNLQDQTNNLQTTLTRFVTEDQVINSSRFYVRTGGNNNPSIIQFYKTRAEVSTGNGSLFRDDEIGAIEFAGNDGNDKVIGSRAIVFGGGRIGKKFCEIYNGETLVIKSKTQYNHSIVRDYDTIVIASSPTKKPILTKELLNDFSGDVVSISRPHCIDNRALLDAIYDGKVKRAEMDMLDPKLRDEVVNTKKCNYYKHTAWGNDKTAYNDYYFESLLREINLCLQSKSDNVVLCRTVNPLFGD